jgi:hypothetical protein
MSDPTTQPTAPAAPPAPVAPSWLGENPDAELLGHTQVKGWQSPADAVKSHRELEKLFGADKAGRTVTLPAGDDPAEWAQVFTKLGRPETPDGYKLPAPEGADAGYIKAMAEVMHKHGIPMKAAQAIAEANNAYMATALEAATANQTAALEAEHAQIRKDWGNEYELRRELAKRAAVNLGLDEASIDALEKVGGYGATMKALAKMGDLMREHGAEGLGELGSFGKTPEGAKAERLQLLADADWRKRAMVPNSKEWAHIQKLDGIIAGSNQ